MDGSLVRRRPEGQRGGPIGQSLRRSEDFPRLSCQEPPAEVAVIAQAGIAGIHKDNRKWDDAIAAYNLVKTKYPGTSQAVEADYWIGICTQQKGDNEAAAPILDAFAKPTLSMHSLRLHSMPRAAPSSPLGRKIRASPRSHQ